MTSCHKQGGTAGVVVGEAARNQSRLDGQRGSKRCLFIAEINDADILEFSKVKIPFCQKENLQNKDAKCSLGHYVCHCAGSGEWMICNNDVWPSSPFSGGQNSISLLNPPMVCGREHMSTALFAERDWLPISA